MMRALALLLAVLGVPRGTRALPTPRNVVYEASEAVLSTGCAQELAMAFAALPAACGVEEGGDDAFESGGWEARAAACLVGRHGCSPVCAAAVQVLRPAAGLLRGLGAAVAAADERERRAAPVVTRNWASSENLNHGTIDGPRTTSLAAAAETPSNRRLQKAASLQLLDLGGGAAAFCSPWPPLCPQFVPTPSSA